MRILCHRGMCCQGVFHRLSTPPPGCGGRFGVVTTPARGAYCLRSSLVGERSPWPWTRSLAMDALNCSLSLFFMAHFPFEFVEEFHEVEGGGARRGAFHDPFFHGGCFGDADGAVDDRLQHETGAEEFFDLLTD